ncbi:GntR family transcriptional regulator [Paenibacillus sp. IB182496]|uniref:GntR family transcriptional regulator n=1 Tax=Paenibacillus sabuli TaxID=2772509 RepID=A0A927BX62_9BACL|nr:GntR family transcriptional regulator [Paenibacillus sabuli]MBD2847370.1 GntR family transcriptional regulator [Paenibacillus sabuli]
MWIPIQINDQSAEPLYYQIEVQLRALILSGQLMSGTLLPSIRELALQLKCSVITIRRVYQDLEAEGLLRTKQGTGTFVADVGEQARDTHRLKAVEAAMDSAVEAGRRANCTPEELDQLYREAVARSQYKR